MISNRSIDLSIYPSIHLSIDRSICLSTLLSCVTFARPQRTLSEAQTHLESASAAERIREEREAQLRDNVEKLAEKMRAEEER